MKKIAGSRGRGEIPLGNILSHGLNILILCATFAFLAFWRLDLPGLNMDELASIIPFMHWMETGRMPTLGGYHGFSEPLLTAPFFIVLGANESALRITPLFYALLTVPLYYIASLRIFRRKLPAFVSAWLFSSSPIFVISARTGLHHGILVFPLLLVSFLFIESWHRLGRPGLLLSSAFFAGLTLGARSWMVSFLPSVLAAAAFLRRDVQFRIPKSRWLLALSAVLMIAASNLLFTMKHRGLPPTDEWLRPTDETSRLAADPSYRSGLLKHFQHFRGHLKQTSSVLTVLGPEGAIPNIPSEVVFWTSLLAILVFGVWDKDSSRRVRYGLPACIIFVYFFALFALRVLFLPDFLRMTPGAQENHFLCAFVLYPWIIVGAGAWAWSLLRNVRGRKALGFFFFLCIAGISIPNAQIHVNFRSLLEEKQEAIYCSTLLREIVRYADETGLRILVMPENFAIADGGRFYSRNRLAVRTTRYPKDLVKLATSAPPRTGFLLCLDLPWDKTSSPAAEALRRMPGFREVLFNRPNGRPVFALYHSEQKRSFKRPER